MKKTIMFLGMLSLGLAQAQQNNPYEGKVGINNDKPKATLEIKAHKTDGTSKEGILIPRLTKDEISKITEPEHSTLAFITDVEYTTGTDTNADERVSKVNAPGFYFFSTEENKWVKMKDDTIDKDIVGKTIVYVDKDPNLAGAKFGEVPTEDPDFAHKPALTKQTGSMYVDTEGNIYIWKPNQNKYITKVDLNNVLFYNSGTSEDAVGKASSIYRIGRIGIGVRKPISSIHTRGTISGFPYTHIGPVTVDETKGSDSETDTTFNTLEEAINYANTIVNNGRVFIQIRNASSTISKPITIYRDMYIGGANPSQERTIDLNAKINLYNGVTLGFTEGRGLKINQNVPVAFDVSADNTILLGGFSGIEWNFTANDQKLVGMSYSGAGYNDEVQLSMSRVKFTPNTFTGLGWMDPGYLKTGSLNIGYWGTTLPTNMSYARVGKIMNYSTSNEFPHNIAGTTLAFSGLDATNNNALVERMRIDKTGYVGIGQATPKQKLDVNGAIKVGTVSDKPAEKKCNSTNAGTMSYNEVNGTGVFGFCTKKQSGEHVWFYLQGGQLHGTSANGGDFGSGL